MTLKSVSIVILASLSLAACGGGSKGPDEFEVLSRAPLAIPPEAELSPPRPGEPRAQEIDPGQQAFEALFPGKKLTRSTPKSQSEYGLLKRMARSSADIRSNAGGDVAADVVKKSLILADLLDSPERTNRPDNVEVYRVSDGN